MAKRFTRSQILERLKQQIEKDKPVLIFGAGTGLTAKCAEVGGADIICVYSTAKYRMMGEPSLMAWLPYSNANEHVLEMAEEILPVVKDVPCIAGVGAHDPSLDIERFIDKILDIGFSGVTNEPFVGMYGREFGKLLEKAGLGFSKEVKLIETAHKKGVFTIAWAFTPEEAKTMAKAGADIIGAIIGVTTGGLTGADKSVTLKEATEEVREICKAARKINPDIMVVTHGGPFKDVETAEYSIVNSNAVGYVAGSSGERIPTEKAVIELTKRYKEMKLG